MEGLKLGFGLMRLPQQDGKIDVEEVKRMVDLYLQAGGRYFDTSWGYTGSEEAMREALFARYPRESFLFATKSPVWLAKSKQEAQAMLQTSLERTGAGYIDYYLLHNLGENRTHFFDDYDMWEFAKQKKEEGIVRHIGFSFHDQADELDRILTLHPEVDFVQLQINYADWDSATVQSRACYETARKHGKPIIVMEPVKGGILANLPPAAADVFRALDETASQASWGIRFAASLEGVMMVLSGMSDSAQMENNLSYMKDFRPLSTGEMDAALRAGQILQRSTTIACTACRYCAEVCPQNVAIPGIFEAVNLYEIYHDLQTAKGRYKWNTRGHGYGAASDCLHCGACEEACPQHLSIRELLEKAGSLLEG